LDDAQGGGTRGSATEELILRTVAAHADSLLRTARRFSLCPDDAQDAYQRAIEIFMAHADRLDPKRAPAWLHVVVKREAQAIRRSRQKLVASDDLDLDAHEARSVPTPDEQLTNFDLMGRSAEALQRLKPQELRALWLRAQGHSYNEIGALTGWSYTKVNRCLSEGRRNFLSRYAEIESGAECARWLPIISALVDGEATAEQLLDLRPHLRNCPGCRATLRALRDSSRPLAAVLPIPAAAGAVIDPSEHVSNLFTRVYEFVAGGLHDRAAISVTKVQAVLEATAAGKAAAIAGAAAAVAGGGYVTVERTLVEGRVDRPAVAVQKSSTGEPASRVAVPVARPRTSQRPSAQATKSPNEFQQSAAGTSRAPEFATHPRLARRTTLSPTGFTRAAARSASIPPASRAPAPAPAPEFAPAATASEFGP
jgi:RNA polymerase sigma factor (sigma-70 family)